MNKNSNDISLASYFNDITIHFYEDMALVQSIGMAFGFDIYKDYFLALSILYPSDCIVSYPMQSELQHLLLPIIKHSPANQAISSQQFVLCDKGVVLFLISSTKEELIASSKLVTESALSILNSAKPDSDIRIGIGTPESSFSGIELTYQNSIQAVNVGEKFKKERRILDYISMEIYSAINAMVIAYGENLINSILKQLSAEEQLILGKYYKCKESIADTAAVLQIDEDVIGKCLQKIKDRTGLDINDTEDNFKLNFIMIAKRVLEKEKSRK